MHTEGLVCRLHLCAVSSHGRRGEQTLWGLFNKGINPILFTRVQISWCNHLMKSLLHPKYCPIWDCMLNHFSCVWVLTTLWTAAYQAQLSMGFSRQKYWSVLPCTPPGDLPDSRIKPKCLKSPASAGRLFATSTTWEAQIWIVGWHIESIAIYSCIVTFYHYYQ